MLNEKYNDPFRWKNKLEGLSSLPGETRLNKDSSWERLHERLQQRPRMSKAGWYWAAASILLACSIPLLIKNKNENVVVKTSPLQKQESIVPTEQLQILPLAPLVKASIPEYKIPVEKISTKEQQETASKNTIQQVELITDAEEIPAAKDPLVSPIPLSVKDTQGSVAVLAPVKKKLLIVHINEVDPPAVQVFPPSNYVQRSIRMKLGNKKTANQNIASQQ